MLPPLGSSCLVVPPRAAPQLPAAAFAFGNWQRSSPAPLRSVSRTAHAWPALFLSSVHSGTEEILPHHRGPDTTSPPDLPALDSSLWRAVLPRTVSACPSAFPRYNAAWPASDTVRFLRSPCPDPAPKCGSLSRTVVRSAPRFLPAWSRRCGFR